MIVWPCALVIELQPQPDVSHAGADRRAELPADLRPAVAGRVPDRERARPELPGPETAVFGC